MRRAHWLLLITLTLTGLSSGPAHTGAESTPGGCRVFAATLEPVCGPFLLYWESHGGLAQQGYPLSPELAETALDGRPYTVQYFERAVFEWHPENAPPYDVLLAQLGTFRYRAKYAESSPLPTPPIPTPAGNPCPIFPADNIWNRDISALPVHRLSAAYIASVAPDSPLRPGFGSRLWQGQTIGMPITIVGPGQPLVPVHLTRYSDQSDPGPYPVPPWARIQGGADSDSDRHVIIWDQGRCA